MAALYRDALPQLSGGIFLTDGGLETVLVFLDRMELPCFAAFPLIESADGQEFYFHRNAVVAGDFEALSLGDEVRFAESEGDKGPTASSVHKIGTSHIAAP